MHRNFGFFPKELEIILCQLFLNALGLWFSKRISCFLNAQGLCFLMHRGFDFPKRGAENFL